MRTSVGEMHSAGLLHLAEIHIATAACGNIFRWSQSRLRSNFLVETYVCLIHLFSVLKTFLHQIKSIGVSSRTLRTCILPVYFASLVNYYNSRNIPCWGSSVRWVLCAPLSEIQGGATFSCEQVVVFDVSPTNCATKFTCTTERRSARRRERQYCSCSCTSALTFLPRAPPSCIVRALSRTQRAVGSRRRENPLLVGEFQRDRLLPRLHDSFRAYTAFRHNDQVRLNVRTSTAKIANIHA